MARSKKDGTAKLKKDKAPTPAVTQEIFNIFFAEYCGKRQLADDANAALRGTLKRAKAAGIATAELVQVRGEQRMDRGKLEAKIRAEQQYRAWLALPTGRQAEMFGDAADADAGLTAAEKLRAAGESGLEAGKAGHARDSNPHVAGTELHAAFDRNWIQGQETIAETLTRPSGAQRRKTGGPMTADHEAAGHA